MEEIAVQVCELASKLRNSIKIVNKKIQELNPIFTTLDENHRYDSTVPEVFKLKKDQVLLKEKFDWILSKFFSSDHGNVELVLK